MGDNVSINITANGETFKVVPNAGLKEFLESLGFDLKRVVVERNRNPLTPAEARNTTLEDGDNLEIVRIVAGG